MSLNNKMIRVAGIGAILMIAQAVPAFAEKVTLACSYGAGYHVGYLTIDTNARTVIDDQGPGPKGPWPTQITEYRVTWEEKARDGTMFRAEYDRKRASYCGMGTNGCAGGDRVPCVRDTAPRPF